MKMIVLVCWYVRTEHDYTRRWLSEGMQGEDDDDDDSGDDNAPGSLCQAEQECAWWGW